MNVLVLSKKADFPPKDKSLGNLQSGNQVKLLLYCTEGDTAQEMTPHQEGENGNG